MVSSAFFCQGQNHVKLGRGTKEQSNLVEIVLGTVHTPHVRGLWKTATKQKKKKKKGNGKTIKNRIKCF